MAEVDPFFDPLDDIDINEIVDRYASDARARRLKDLAARAAWTAAQAGLALVTTESLGIPAAWAVPIAWALSAVKSFVAGKVGDPYTNQFR